MYRSTTTGTKGSTGTYEYKYPNGAVVPRVPNQTARLYREYQIVYRVSM